MGFKLKKKNTGDTAQKSSSGVLTKTKSKIDEFAKLFGESDKSKPFIQMAIASIIVAIILLLVLFYTVPRNNDLTRSLGELKLLSQTSNTKLSRYFEELYRIEPKAK
jgi:twitching motility protein PilJ